MQIKKEHICTALTLIYHLTFLGGASFYVTEFQKTRDTIIQQVDRVEAEGKKLRKHANDVRTSIIGVSIKINSVENKLDQVKRTCEKMRF